MGRMRTFVIAITRKIVPVVMLACLGAASQAGVLTSNGTFQYWYDKIEFDDVAGVYTALAHKGSTHFFKLEVPVNRVYDVDFTLASTHTATGQPVEAWPYENNADYSYWDIHGGMPVTLFLAPKTYFLKPRPGDMMGDLGDWEHAAGFYEDSLFPEDESIAYTLTLSWDDGTAVPEPGVAALLLLGLCGLAARKRKNHSA